MLAQGQSRKRSLAADMVAEELPIVAAQTTVAKKAIKKGIVARKTAAKKAKKPKAKAKKAKKAKKAPKKKKAKKKKKRKAKKKKATNRPGGVRIKGTRKSKAMGAAAKKNAAAQKKKGTGLFKVMTLSADLAAVCGKNKMARTDAVRAVWAYIKKRNLNKGRTINPDATLKKVFTGGSMFKLAGAMSKHFK